MPTPNIQIFGKPLEKLIDTVSKAIGVRYKPTAIRNEADAKAYEIEKIAEAKAKASIIKADADSEIAARARQRLYFQEMARQQNIDQIVAKAEENLSDNPSDEPVDEDWRTKFFNQAQDVTSEELQKVWAKILANEVNRPGQTSIRTLDTLSNMSKIEAQKFEILSSLSTVNGNVLKMQGLDLTDYGLSYDDLSLLRGAGLLLASDNLTITYQAIYKTERDAPHFGTILVYKGVHFFIAKKGQVEPGGKIVFEQYNLTQAGKELLAVIGSPPNIIYINNLKDWLIKGGYEVRQLTASSM